MLIYIQSSGFLILYSFILFLLGICTLISITSVGTFILIGYQYFMKKFQIFSREMRMDFFVWLSFWRKFTWEFRLIAGLFMFFFFYSFIMFYLVLHYVSYYICTIAKHEVEQMCYILCDRYIHLFFLGKNLTIIFCFTVVRHNY